jgi:hypothetical protein
VPVSEEMMIDYTSIYIMLFAHAGAFWDEKFEICNGSAWVCWLTSVWHLRLQSVIDLKMCFCAVVYCETRN